jgi:hypothetical protein
MDEQQQQPDPNERRLGSVLLNAFNLACDQHDLEVARVVHHALELVMTRRTGVDRIEKRPEMAQPVEEAYERLIQLQRTIGL